MKEGWQGEREVRIDGRRGRWKKQGGPEGRRDRRSEEGERDGRTDGWIGREGAGEERIGDEVGMM